jgi:hypothetical protein
VLDHSRLNAYRHTSFVLGMAVLILLCCPIALSAQAGTPSDRAGAVPTLEALPHIALPRGAFKAWCGRNDRYLMDVDGRLEAYDAGVKSATIAVSSSWPVQCSLDGRQLAYVDTTMGYLTEIDIASGSSRLRASYKSELGVGIPAPSPDLKTVATTTPLTLAPDVGDLKSVLIKRNEESSIRWSDDSSKLLIVHPTSAEVLDVSGATIASGPLPNGTYFENGWFAADRNSLILYLSPRGRGESVVVKCRLAQWKCDLLKSRVDIVSVGGRGVMATIGPLGKPPARSENRDDSPIIFGRYSAEVRDGLAQPLARQTLLTATGHTDFEINMAPSGKKAILTWHARPTECKPTLGQSDCLQGILVDLSKVLDE